MPNALETTAADLISALTPKPRLLPQTKPEFLCDVLRMKRERGDTDCENFKRVTRTFAYGRNATISGAAWAMRQWIAKRPDHVSDELQARRVAFLADLDRVLAGDLTGWDAESGAAA